MTLKQEIKKLLKRKKALTYQEIADRFGVTRQYVHLIAKEIGMANRINSTRRARNLSDKGREILAIKSEGMACTEAARKYGYSPSFICKCRRDYL